MLGDMLKLFVALIGLLVVTFGLMASGYAPPQYMGWSLAATAIAAIGFIALVLWI